MDLKNTKVTPLKPTGQPSKILNPLFITEKLSAASKNTYKFHRKGEEAEAIVKNYFIYRGWIISSERAKFDGVEVDLIVEKQNRRVLLEVKLLDCAWRSFERVGTKQIQRLKFVLLGMRKRERTLKIEGYVVFVLTGSQLHFISLDEVI